jgi:hypothetical protein
MKNYYHVLVTVGEEIKDIKFPYSKSIVSFDNGMIKIETENSFGDFNIAGYFNENSIVGFFEDVHTD